MAGARARARASLGCLARHEGARTLPIEPRLMPRDTLRSHRKWSKPSARRSRATRETWLESCAEEAGRGLRRLRGGATDSDASGRRVHGMAGAAHHCLDRDAGGGAVKVGLSDQVLHRLRDLLEHAALSHTCLAGAQRRAAPGLARRSWRARAGRASRAPASGAHRALRAGAAAAWPTSNMAAGVRRRRGVGWREAGSRQANGICRVHFSFQEVDLYPSRPRVEYHTGVQSKKVFPG